MKRERGKILGSSHVNAAAAPASVCGALRIAFDDPNATQLYIDPQTGEIAGSCDRNACTYRWLINFAHDYDLPVLLRNQPARDILVWALSLAGLVVSISSVIIGWRTLARG